MGWHAVLAIYLAIVQIGMDSAKAVGFSEFPAFLVGLILPFGVLLGSFHALVAITETFIPWLRK